MVLPLVLGAVALVGVGIVVWKGGDSIKDTVYNLTASKEQKKLDLD